MMLSPEQHEKLSSLCRMMSVLAAEDETFRAELDGALDGRNLHIEAYRCQGCGTVHVNVHMEEGFRFVDDNFLPLPVESEVEEDP